MKTVALLALVEVLRKRVLSFAMALTLVFLGFYGVALHYIGLSLAAGSGGPLAAQMATMQMTYAGLYIGSFIVAFLAIFAAVGAISGEVEDGSMHAIATKPIRRGEIVVGRFLGYSTMMAVYAALFFSVLNALVWWQLDSPVMAGFFPAMAVFMLLPVVLVAVTIMGSTWLTPLANGTVVIMMYALSVIGGMVEQVGVVLRNASLVNAGIITSLVLPVDATYRRVASMLTPEGNPLAALQQMGPFGAMSTPSNAMLGYTIAYVGCVVYLAVRIFEKRDI